MPNNAAAHIKSDTGRVVVRGRDPINDTGYILRWSLLIIATMAAFYIAAHWALSFAIDHGWAA